MITREEFIKETVIGKRVVHKVSGYTGEVRLVFPWGVEVWVKDRGNEKERWFWNMITKRFPRKVKRFPRPFRFPRLMPTLQCHCKIGKMEVRGEGQVQCQRCTFLIGNEAFPNRYARAERLLHDWVDQQAHVRDSEPAEQKRRPSHQRRARPKRSVHHGVQARKKKKASQKGKRNLVIRSGGRKEVRKGYGKGKRKAKRKNPSVSKRHPVPSAARNHQRKKGGRKSRRTGQISKTKVGVPDTWSSGRIYV